MDITRKPGRNASETLFDARNRRLHLIGRGCNSVVRNAPDRFGWRRIIVKARDQMPVDVRKLVAKQSVIHFFRVEHLGKDFCEPAHFLHELNSLGRSQMKQFRGMAFKDDHGPAGEKLIVVEVGHRQSKIGDEMVGARPGPRAGFASGIGHGCVAFRHSSSVMMPFLRSSWINLSVCRSWVGLPGCAWLIDCFGSTGGRFLP